MWNLDPDKHICRVRFCCLCELNELYLNICKEYPSLYSTAWCMKPEQVCFIWQKMNVIKQDKSNFHKLGRIQEWMYEQWPKQTEEKVWQRFVNSILCWLSFFIEVVNVIKNVATIPKHQTMENKYLQFETDTGKCLIL